MAKPAGMTPITSRGLESTVITRPMTARIAAKPALPIAVAQDHRVRRTGPMVVEREPSAEHGLHAKSRKDPSRHLQRVRAFRSPRPCHRRLGRSEQTELLERLAVLRVRREHPGRQREVVRPLRFQTLPRRQRSRRSRIPDREGA